MDTQFPKNLKKTLTERRDGLSYSLSCGVCSSFDMYQRIVGEIASLDFVLNTIEEELLKLNQEDED